MEEARVGEVGKEVKEEEEGRKCADFFSLGETVVVSVENEKE